MENNDQINGVNTPELEGEDIENYGYIQNGLFTPENKPEIVKVNATLEVYEELQSVYDIYNQELFDGELPGALLVITRKRNSKGFFSPARYSNKEGVLADEIAMNPEFFLVRSIEEVLSTQAHEMCHQWQFHFGKDVKAGYHNKEFSVKMESIGLITSTTGYPGGDRVGEKMTHYIAEDGPFIKVTRELLKTRFGILWYDRYPNQYMLRPPAQVDVENAEQRQTQIKEDHKKALVDQGKTPSNRGRKKQEVLKVEPAAVSSPAIMVDTPLTQSINTDIVNQEPSATSVTNVVAKLIKRQEAQAKAGKRVKYSCPSCQDSVWGKPDMSLICGKDGCEHAALQVG